jgi:exonuclease SbcD
LAKRLPIRVVHTADLHIGMENYGRWNPATGLHDRLDDYMRSLDQVVEFAIAESADVFLVAGDIYKTKDPSPTHQREFARRVQRLAAAGVQVVLLVGNHDMPNRHGDANPLDIYASLALPGVTIFRRPDLVTLETRRGPLQVAAVPHLPRSFLMAREEAMPRSVAEAERRLESVLDEVLTSLAADVDPAIPAILTAHLSIDRATLGSERELMLGKGLTLPLETLANPVYDYVAMGHIHKHQILGESPACVYPGSLDRIDFGEADDDKGFCVVDVARGSTTVERVRIDVRAFKTIRADLTASEDPTAALLEAIAKTEVEGAVVRLAYTIQAERSHEVHEAVVRQALTGAFDVAWRPELVQGAARSRDPGLDETVADQPLLALERYLALRPELADQADRLMARAEALLAETGS